MQEVFLGSNHFFLQTSYKQPAPHKHAAAHIIAAGSSAARVKVWLNGQTYNAAGFIIPSFTEHTADCDTAPLLLFFFDQTTTAAKAIREARALSEEEALAIRQNCGRFNAGELSCQDFVNRSLAALGLPPGAVCIRDKRMIETRDYIDAHIEDKPTVRELASRVFLSESRFSHLFRSEFGLPYNAYLTMRKLYHSYLALSRGRSVTEAALAGGFASPSHLAAVNKRLLGLAVTDLTEGLICRETFL